MAIEKGRGWHVGPSGAARTYFLCRKSAFDGDRAIYSDALPRADRARSLRQPAEAMVGEGQSNVGTKRSRGATARLEGCKRAV